jgi:hypothetical protein
MSIEIHGSIVPNTLDTAIKWKGVAANNSEEELTFVITGDMYACLRQRGPRADASVAMPCGSVIQQTKCSRTNPC